MSQESLNQIIEIEEKFRELSEIGYPNIVDNGLFVDAVLNVTEVMKNQKNMDHMMQQGMLDNHIQILDNLYRSLKDFESLYNSSFHSTE